MLLAFFSLCLTLPLGTLDAIDATATVDERPVLVDPAGDAPPPPQPLSEPEATPPTPPAKANKASPATATPPADTRSVPPPTLEVQGLAVPAVMTGAVVGSASMAALGLLFVGSAYDVVSLGASSAQSRAFSELVGWALLASAPAFGGLLAGAVALLFVDDADIEDWADLALCTGVAWVASLGVVALVVLGGLGAGCNPGGCDPNCGNCGSHNSNDLVDGPANTVAAGAVFGAFAGGAIGATILFFSSDPGDSRISLYLAAAAAAGAVVGAPIGAAIPAFDL